MMGEKRTPTFADVVREESARTTPHIEPDRAPGEFNENRQLFDLKGQELVRTKARVTAKEAVALVRAGALAASEDCGCGGWAGCQPQWVSEDEMRSLLSNGKPRKLKGNCPTWIDVWTGEGSTLVFAHGDIVWT